jgi:2-oxoglutarate ferredoxin oxidoreductase subunit alpha
VADFPAIDPKFATTENHDDGFMPYLRDEHLARPWAPPGTPGLRHRIGGLEKEDVTGNISYDAVNHERMTHLRQAKVARIARSLPPLEVDEGEGEGQPELLVLSWGSSYGAVKGGIRRVRRSGAAVAHVHLRHMNPLPDDLGDVLQRYPQVLVPEMNLGQLAMLIRAKYLVDAESLTKVQGQPLLAHEIEDAITRRVER